MVAKAYRLLRAVLWTAVREDEILKSKPCRMPRGEGERAGKRAHLTLAQVNRLMQAMPDRYRVMILLAAMASLRCDEITALLQQADCVEEVDGDDPRT